MHLILIRHARPERIEGATGGADPNLTDIGHKQASAMAAWMAQEHLDALYVSPMARARQTSAPLEAATGLDAAVRNGIREFDADEPHYLPMEDLKADKAAWREFLDRQATADRTEFIGEVTESVQEIIGAHQGQTVAVVCHGGVINAWAAITLGLTDSMFFEPDYTSVHRFVCSSRGHRSIQSLNETAHLRPHPELQL